MIILGVSVKMSVRFEFWKNNRVAVVHLSFGEDRISLRKHYSCDHRFNSKIESAVEHRPAQIH